jgi:hypothetical protein
MIKNIQKNNKKINIKSGKNRVLKFMKILKNVRLSK